MSQSDSLEARVGRLLAGDPEELAHPYETWNELRETKPVLRMDGLVVLSKHADVRVMLGDNHVLYSRADTRLHEAFVQHCGNAYLQAAYATAGAKIAALRTHLSAPADVLHSRGHEQHRRLMEYFGAGDFKSFEALMREHVVGTRDNYVASLKARRQNDGQARPAAH